MRHLPGLFVDPAQPVNWANSLNDGLVSRYTNLPGGQWGRGILFRDLCRRNDGVMTGGPLPPWATGARPGGFGSLSFTSSFAQYVTTGITPTKAFTWMAWAKLSSGSLNTVIACDGADYLLMDITTPSPSVFSVDGLSSQTFGVSGLTTGVWYHFAWTRAGDSISGGYQFYVNGVPGTAADTGSFTPGNPITIAGRVDSAQYFDGLMDDVRIYSQCLSAVDVLRVYRESLVNSPNTLRWVSPIAYSIPAVTASQQFFMLMGVGA